MGEKKEGEERSGEPLAEMCGGARGYVHICQAADIADRCYHRGVETGQYIEHSAS